MSRGKLVTVKGRDYDYKEAKGVASVQVHHEASSGLRGVLDHGARLPPTRRRRPHVAGPAGGLGRRGVRRRRAGAHHLRPRRRLHVAALGDGVDGGTAAGGRRPGVPAGVRKRLQLRLEAHQVGARCVAAGGGAGGVEGALGRLGERGRARVDVAAGVARRELLALLHLVHHLGEDELPRRAVVAQEVRHAALGRLRLRRRVVDARLAAPGAAPAAAAAQQTRPTTSATATTTVSLTVITNTTRHAMHLHSATHTTASPLRPRRGHLPGARGGGGPQPRGGVYLAVMQVLLRERPGDRHAPLDPRAANHHAEQVLRAEEADDDAHGRDDGGEPERCGESGG